MIKWANGVVVNGAYLIDQLPGDTWFHDHLMSYRRVDLLRPMQAGGSRGIPRHSVRCRDSHLSASRAAAYPSQTNGRREGGPPPAIQPSRRTGYADNSYGGTGKLTMNALQVLGYDMSCRAEHLR